ncbi:kinase-like domain-containing protein [Daldinia decipiens]|uniref:kinase-like domain-containing protein n=1 Tax=Daldinia decipiens TaxID=326647 RepID=UPI0020C1C507|nr:kinase-like domain-containing protein [Daldinia decipiens]KAI1657784.1 kinase-like domain-containing protein [Daldinia decipiens]
MNNRRRRSNRRQNRPYGSNILLKHLIRDRREKPRSGEDPAFLRARRSLRKLQQNFEENYPGRIKFQRVLGYGGFGLATMWKVKTRSGRDVDVAVKTSIRRGDDESELRSEIYIQGELLRGAEHIVQLIDVEEDVPATAKLYNNPALSSPIMIMEVLERNTLADLIDRINKARLTNYEILAQAENPWAAGRYDRSGLQIGYIPNRILWRLFLCLARGITGMAYGPPTDPNYVAGDPYREFVRERPMKQLLHMDLDIYNVLIGDVSHTLYDPEHVMSPKIKIADFGIAMDWRSGLTVRQREFLIPRGKRDFYAPEQKDYKRSARDPRAISPAINVWAIGLIMLNLLTLAHPRLSSWEARVRTYYAPREGNPNYQQQFITWGWFLLDHEEHHPSPFIMAFDYELRLLIARCLETYGPRRPTPAQLLGVIEENLERGDARSQWLSDQRIAREEQEYRQRLIIEEQRESDAMQYSDYYDPDFDDSRDYGHSTRPRDIPPDDPLSVDPTNMNQWLDQLDPDAPVFSNNLSRSQPLFGSRTAVKEQPLISISEEERISNPWDYIMGGNRSPRPAPPQYDPVPIYEQTPVAGPSTATPGPSTAFPQPPPPPRVKTPAAQRVITRNDYRPVTEFQTPPELEDVQLLVKFYMDHLRDPPQRVDPYAKLWSKSTAEPSITNQTPTRVGRHVRFRVTPVPPGGIPAEIWDPPPPPGFPPGHRPAAKREPEGNLKQPPDQANAGGVDEGNIYDATPPPRHSPHVKFAV